MKPGNPILQFGTGRFLQAHVGLFVSEALARGDALGGITVVQTTGSPASTARTAAMAAGEGYEVRIRGLVDGRAVESSQRCRAVRTALVASAHWAAIREDVADGTVQVIVSKTGDDGWRPDPADGPALLDTAAAAPRAFPAKLLVLLHARWTRRPAAALTILPCELVARNGHALRDLVIAQAREWGLPPAFADHLRHGVTWANSLVDRIVSEALEPVGAVAEPYALWAVERQQGLVLPCAHPAIVLTDDLGRHERLKLHLLNLGHTVLAERWLRTERGSERTVLQAMAEPGYRGALESVWRDEVLPVFDAWGLASEAAAYVRSVRDRLLNPYLAHRLADIAQNHAQKKARRLEPVVEAARVALPLLPQPALRAALAAD
ncbi:MAG TPA: mannitol dehydrogenase family protein [Burkholderiaceae bacterium]